MRFIGIIPIIAGMLITFLIFRRVVVPESMPFAWKLYVYLFGFLMVMAALKLFVGTLIGLFFWDKKKDKGE